MSFRSPATTQWIGVRSRCSTRSSYCAARASRPSVPAAISPKHATARFEPVDYQPGVPPRVITTPDEQDLANLVADVRAAREQADAVVLSLHWGVHFVPRLIADYQRIVAQVAFDAG